MRRVVGKRYVGKPHARIERGMGNHVRSETVPDHRCRQSTLPSFRRSAPSHRTIEPASPPNPRGAELTPSQYEVLATIVKRGPLRHSEVAAIEGLNPTMLSQIVGKLEGFGLVARLADTADGRVVHVAATKKGLFGGSIRRERSDALSLALKGLSDEEHSKLLNALPALESLAEKLGERA